MVMWMVAGVLTGAAIADDPARLQQLENCRLVETNWADGDSFLVKTAEGKTFTARLYGVDCLEWHVSDETDGRRLRAQRRYFGITGAGGSARASIALAKEFGGKAWQEVKARLADPFTVHTTFADARGDGRYQRYYVFITMEGGEDLASHLVSTGLARAYGVYRSRPDGRSREECRADLADLELRAAKLGKGIWKHTDWEKLPAERRQQRREEAELALALSKKKVPQGIRPEDFQIDPNTAARDRLMMVRGIGEELANRIIEHRPYRTASELLRVPGIGPKRLDELKPFLKFKSD